MPTTDDRLWAVRGRGLIGRASDGRPDYRMTLTPVRSDSLPPDETERTRLLRQIADIHNGLNAAEHKVLEEIRAADPDWPLNAGELARRTGFTQTYIDQVLDQLNEKGWVERPPKGVGQRRPVRLARVEEGAVR